MSGLMRYEMALSLAECDNAMKNPLLIVVDKEQGKASLTLELPDLGESVTIECDEGKYQRLIDFFKSVSNFTSPLQK